MSGRRHGNSAAKGNSREYAVRDQLRARRFRADRISRSGQSRTRDGDEFGIPADVIAFAPAESAWPHLWIEVGGIGKRLAVTFAAMTRHPIPPGTVPIVARCIKRRWKWTLADGRTFDELDDVLESFA